MSDIPAFLIQQKPCLSIKEAEKIVDYYLLFYNIKPLPKGKSHQIITKKSLDGKEQKIKYHELVKQVRNTGICGFIVEDIDRNDSVFGGTLGGIGTVNYGMKIGLEWAGYKKELVGPCRTVPSELDLSNDIEFYKDETCFESAEHDFDMCYRNYRGYLLSTISLIDCYINRHILLFNYNGRDTDGFKKLKDSRNTEERIELFISEFCNFQFDKFKASKPWDDFKKLKDLRNNVTHSLSPFLGAEIKEISMNLNLSIHGVGTLLKKLQEGQGRYSLSFIERVRNSPIVHFNEITFKSDGVYLEKKHFNKINR